MRTRFQRTADAKFFTGWVSAFEDDEIIVRASLAHAVLPDQSFFFQIFGDGEDILFVALYKGVYKQDIGEHLRQIFAGSEPGKTQGIEQEYCFTIVSDMRSIASKHQARMVVDFATAVFKPDSATHQVLDISQGGFAVQSAEAIEVGTQLEIGLQTPLPEVVCSATVRYCRPMGNGLPGFRIGLQIAEIDRVQGMRWNQLLNLAKHPNER